VSTRLGLKGIPAEAEEIMAIRDILLARRTGGHIHLCHMSTRGSVELIRWAYCFPPKIPAPTPDTKFGTGAVLGHPLRTPHGRGFTLGKHFGRAHTRERLQPRKQLKWEHAHDKAT